MTFFQLIKEIFDNSRERIKTPITGAFFTAFILWNWRPILQLMFSKREMEHRIEIVDYNFIDFWSWLTPLLLAIGYITIVPLFTNMIDGWMVKNKESRVDKIYESKFYDLEKRIKIAREELKLTNVESDNKELEVLQQQIKSLEERNVESLRSHTNAMKGNSKTINELNNQIEKLSKDYAKLVRDNHARKQTDNDLVDKERTFYDDYLQLKVFNLTIEEREKLIDVYNGKINLLQLPTNLLKEFHSSRLVDIEDEIYSLSQVGVDIVELILNKRKPSY